MINQSSGKSALSLAIARRDLAAVSALLAAGADVNERRGILAGWTHLYSAVWRRDHALIRLLCEAGADPNIYVDTVHNAVYLAVSNNDVEALRILLAHGGVIDAAGGPGDSKLCGTLRGDGLDMLRLLIEHGIDLDQKGFNGVTLLALAVTHRDDSRLAANLIAVGANVNTRDDMSRTPLHMAARAGTTTSIQFLLDAGADINVVDEFGCSPLHWAIKKGNLASADLLINAGADVTVATEEADLSMSHAIQQEAMIWKLLLEGRDVPTESKAIIANQEVGK